MNIADFIGEIVQDPIKSNNAVGDVRLLWDHPQKQRALNQVLTADSGKTLPYTLLYYIPGLTTYCGVRAVPILTGYMSGCYLFRYRYNGELRAAHVGTDDLRTDWSDKAKDAWKTIANDPNTTDAFGYDPLKDISMNLLMEGQRAGNPQIFGIWLSNGSMRVGVLSFNPSHPGRKVFVGFEPAPLRPWSSIQHDAKMQ
jgi:hypothetical protein